MHSASTWVARPARHRDGVPDQSIVLCPHRDALCPVQDWALFPCHAVLQGQAVVAQQGRRGRRFGFIWMGGQEVLFEF